MHLNKIIVPNGGTMRFREKLARFFYGRYGADALYYALFATYFIIWAILFFIGNPIARIILSVLQTAILVIMIMRVFSRNIYKRQLENQAFLKAFKPVKNFFILTKNRIRDFKSFRYRKCPHCKAMLRLPKRKGAHPVICPRCKQRFTAKVLF